MSLPHQHQSDSTLLALSAGLLPPDREDRARQHLDACVDCAVRWESMLSGREAEGASERHLPAAMVARWDRAQAQLQGIERELVGQHLERCPACRQELQALGHEPVLSPVKSLGPPAAPPKRTVHRATGRGRFARWPTLGLAGGLAIAAVLVIALLGPWEGAGLPGGTTDDPTLATGGGVVPWVAPGQFRGDPARVAVPAGSRMVTLLLGVPAGMDVRRPASVTVLDPGGSTLLESVVATADLASGTLVVFLQAAEPLAPGTFTVVLAQAAVAGEAGRQEIFTFQVLHREPSR